MKKYQNESVIQEWVGGLPFMQQALLMTGMREPDGCPKYNTAKNIIKFMRGAVLKPAGQIEGNEDSFMWIHYSVFDECMKHFFSDTDQYPVHFLMHLIHSAEVIGYKHDNKLIASCWLKFYKNACDAFHMTPETVQDMDSRMKL